MSIEIDQLSMSERFADGLSIGGQIIGGKWVSKQSGYFADDGRYPDNRSTWAHGDVLTTETISVEETAAVMGMKINTATQRLVSYIMEPATYKSIMSDGIATSQTAGQLSLPGEGEI